MSIKAGKFKQGQQVSLSRQALADGLRVLEAEANALIELAKSLDGSFAEAVDVINAMKQRRQGRLIVAGIGKSGHVAKKIAATLASTGTPSFFVHPGEASHGDLGMITADDAVLMLSNSGESAELADLIHYTRRFGIKLIAITANVEGALGRHCDVLLQLPKVAEACPNGLAPTTSTTMMLALGDALAVALLERMGLTATQFKVFHPGGKLGRQLLKVSEIMWDREKLPMVREDATMGDVMLIMSEKNIGSVVVVDSGDPTRLKGIVTEGDWRRHMAPDLLGRCVAEIMTRTPMTIDDRALAAEAVNMMTKTPGRYVTSLIAVDGAGRLTGVIRLQDCLQAGIA